MGIARAQLTETHRADEGDEATQGPDRKSEARGAGSLGDDRRVQEDACAEDAANDEHRAVEQVEAAIVGGCRLHGIEIVSPATTPVLHRDVGSHARFSL